MKTLNKIKRGSCGCCLFIVLAFLLLVGGLFFLTVRAVRAAPALPPDREIVLAVDNSPSMWDCDGVGTDPQMLRVDATRLFIQYLGADSSAVHRLALLHFGGDVRQMAPLTNLADPAGRERLLLAVSQPEPIRWTDQWLAMDAARSLLVATGTPGSRRLIVLLTDGEPAPSPVTAAGLNDVLYLRQLERVAETLAQEGTTLAVVLLSDQSTSCGRAVAATWAERWARLAGMTPGGALYTANQAEELLPVYHAIVRELTGAAAGASPATTATLRQGQPLTIPVTVDGALAGLVITIWKAEATTTVQVLDPAGKPVIAGQSGITVTGGDAGNREQVWRVAQPQAGVWQVALNGRGRVSVWQDRILPAPTVTATPTNTETPEPSPTVTYTPTPTRSPAATASEALSPTVTAPSISSATPRPSPTATFTAAMTLATLTPMPTTEQSIAGPQDAGAPRWPWFLGAGTIVGLGGVAVATQRRRGPFLTGQLAPVAAPAGVALLPRDLGSERRRQAYLGQRGEHEWRLPGWQGTVRLTASRDGSVTAVAVAGEATLDGQPLHHAQPLVDGAVIGCGEYQIRYENLLG